MEAGQRIQMLELVSRNYSSANDPFISHEQLLSSVPHHLPPLPPVSWCKTVDCPSCDLSKYPWSPFHQSKNTALVQLWRNVKPPPSHSKLYSPPHFVKISIAVQSPTQQSHNMTPTHNSPSPLHRFAADPLKTPDQRKGRKKWGQAC